jgi:hypothetical protein
MTSEKDAEWRPFCLCGTLRIYGSAVSYFEFGPGGKTKRGEQTKR